eukprot:TRINITY_DN73767_c0_g1_i1.p3 TRINITY_DN73767_c0_g1~~TRINITY_DN73767_c0_g1_i1.p3  ORF type:complete len:303 (+),score=122.75 TRINITY_DN73767_c0_g1_i1:123-1031(+)
MDSMKQMCTPTEMDLPMVRHEESPVMSLDTPVSNSLMPNAMRQVSRGGTPNPIDQTKRKTKICSHWQKGGMCPFNDRCAFAHGDDEKISTRQGRRKEKKTKDQKDKKSPKVFSLNDQPQGFQHTPQMTPVTPESTLFGSFSQIQTPMLLDATPQYMDRTPGLCAGELIEHDASMLRPGELLAMDDGSPTDFMRTTSTAFDTVSLSSSMMVRLEPYGGPHVMLVAVEDTRTKVSSEGGSSAQEEGISDETEEDLSIERARGRCTPVEDEVTGVSSFLTPRGESPLMRRVDMNEALQVELPSEA